MLVLVGGDRPEQPVTGVVPFGMGIDEPPPVVISGISRHGKAELFQIVQTLRAPGGFPCFVQRRQQQCG